MTRVVRTLVTLVTLVPLVLAACATQSTGTGTTAAPAGDPPATSGTVALTHIGEAVQITEDPETTHECEFVAYLSLPGTNASDTNTIRALRNEAGRRGANLVLLVMESRSTISGAEGYLCAD